MNEILQRMFVSEKGLGICVKDKDLNIVFQNDVAKKFCHTKAEGHCEQGCMSLFIANRACRVRSEGFQLFVDRKVKEQFVDLAILNNGDEYVTMIYPLGNKHAREMDFFRDKGLSKRELQVIEKVILGMTNTQVLKELGISKATLKTHLNNIYKKLPPEIRTGFRRRIH